MSHNIVVQCARRNGERDERAAIVAFLRTVPLNQFDEGTIDAILRGEHLSLTQEHP